MIDLASLREHGEKDWYVGGADLLAVVAEIERLRAALKPFEELARVVLAEAPADAGYVSLFVDSAGRSHRITLDQLRATHQQSGGGK